jgi:YhcG PDDEXK nuclease domain
LLADNMLLRLTIQITKLICFFTTLCYTPIVVIELKAGEFMPEHVSKLNFYISAIDDKLRTPTDEPTIGLLLCASNSKIKVEYAMRGLDKPLGVATYQLEKLVRDNIHRLKSEGGGDVV